MVPPTDTPVAATPAGSKAVPLTMTEPPPMSGPNDGETLVTVGADA